jgi:hypothetical protein
VTKREDNLRGSTLAVECLLFSERFIAVILLVITVFAYTIVSSEQIESDKESLASLIRSWLREVQQKIELHDQQAAKPLVALDQAPKS